jgi:DNA-binding response OmpR family regulator
VLAVDDDPVIREMIRDYLVKHGMRVTAVSDGRTMAEALSNEVVDLIVLDLKLRTEDGMHLARKLRDDSTIPIIMLTGRSDEADRVMGLELGADDYVTKPFSPRELLARLRAVLRRAQPASVAEKMEASGVSIDVSAREVRTGGRLVELTGLEFDLLVALVRRAGRVIPRDALLGEAGRNDTVVGERTVDVHISHLRQKLGDEGSRLIKTVRGVGYLFTKDGP